MSGKKKTSSARCCSCNKRAVRKDGYFVFLTGGAFFTKHKDFVESHKHIEGYLDIGVHGGSSSPDKMVHLGKDQALGEFEIPFCSTRCLRKFFDNAVDKLEEELHINKEKK